MLDSSEAVNSALASDGFSLYADHSLHAPSLLWWELNSVIRGYVRRGALSAEVGAQVVGRFVAHPIQRHDPTLELLDAARTVAARLGWMTAYDATYLAVALSIPGSRVVTRDEAMKRGAGWLVDIIGPAEL